MKLANSTAFANSGQGVIANRDIPKYRLACLFSLFLYKTREETDIYTGEKKLKNQ